MKRGGGGDLGSIVFWLAVLFFTWPFIMGKKLAKQRNEPKPMSDQEWKQFCRDSRQAGLDHNRSPGAPRLVVLEDGRLAQVVTRERE